MIRPPCRGGWRWKPRESYQFKDLSISFQNTCRSTPTKESSVRQLVTDWATDCRVAVKRPLAAGGGECRVTRRRRSVTLSVSQGDGCTLLGPAAPPALSEEPAAPDTDIAAILTSQTWLVSALATDEAWRHTEMKWEGGTEGWLRREQINTNWICVWWNRQTIHSDVLHEKIKSKSKSKSKSQLSLGKTH